MFISANGSTFLDFAAFVAAFLFVSFVLTMLLPLFCLQKGQKLVEESKPAPQLEQNIAKRQNNGGL